MRNVLAVILAAAKGDSLLTLSRVRATASVPFAGHYRLIDFALSNLAHSGINNVAVLTQYLPISLKSHIGIGRPWDLDRRDGGVRLLEPYAATGPAAWYRGTADALAQNVEVLDDNRSDQILILQGADVYRMDYRPLLDFHRAAGADLTVAVKPVPIEKASLYGNVQIGRGNAIIAFEEKPPKPLGPYASLAIYVFDRRFLVNKLKALPPPVDVVSDVIIPAILRDAVYAYLHYDYWAKITTLDEYVATSFEWLSSPPPAFAFDDPTWPVYTHLDDDPPVKFGPGADVENALIADGCIINGRVANAILSRRVYVEHGATVANAIIMDNTRVNAGATVDYAILDKDVVIGARARVGLDVGDPSPNRTYPQQLHSGLVLAGKYAYIPEDSVVGRNCLIDIAVTADAFAPFADRTLPNGTSLTTP